MFENATHRCRWHENPAVRPARPSLMSRILQAIRSRKRQPGRNAIDPEGAWGHWSQGFHDAKKPR